MLLRNYDEFKCLQSFCEIVDNTNTISNMSTFTAIKRYDGSPETIYTKKHIQPFNYFCKAGNTTTVSNFGSNLVCGQIGDEDVGYDDYTISNIPSLTFVSHSLGEQKIENNELVTSYRKVMNNGTGSSVTVDCIGVFYTHYSSYSILMYKEKLATPIEIPADSNVILTFTTRTNLNPNIPADYTATASVE